MRFTYLTTLQITEPARFSYGSTDVFVNNDTSYDHSSAWPNQLAVCVETDAFTIEDAISEAEKNAELTIRLLVISTSASTDNCRFDRAIDYDKGTKDRLFRQEFSVPLSNLSTRELSPEKYEKFHKAISNLDNLLLYEKIERFNRSTRWYRKGLLEEDLLDQYLNYWIALEILEPLLNKKYNIPKDRKEDCCAGCGHISVREISSHKGISELALITGYQEAIAKNLRDTRNQIIHGSESLATLVPRVEELLPALERIVLSGILEILDFSQEDRQDFLREPHYAPKYPIKTLEIIFADMPDSYLSIDSIPFYTSITSEIMTHKESEEAIYWNFSFPHPSPIKRCKLWINYY